jgi:hypothetical protein
MDLKLKNQSVTNLDEIHRQKQLKKRIVPQARKSIFSGL